MLGADMCGGFHAWAVIQFVMATKHDDFGFSELMRLRVRVLSF